MKNVSNQLVIAVVVFAGLFHDRHADVAADVFPLVVDHKSTAVVIRPGEFLQACEPAEPAIEIIKESRILPPGPDTFVNHETDAAYRLGIEIGHIKRVYQEQLAENKVSRSDFGPAP